MRSWEGHTKDENDYIRYQVFVCVLVLVLACVLVLSVGGVLVLVLVCVLVLDIRMCIGIRN